MHFFRRDRFFFSALFFLLIAFPVFSVGQNQQNASQTPPVNGKERYFTAGFNFGMLGWSPTQMQLISGSDVFTRTLNSGVGIVTDISGARRISISANYSVGAQGGMLFKDGKSGNYTGVQLEFQSNKACYSFLPPFNFSAQGDTFAGWVMTDKYLKYSLAVQQCWLRSQDSWLGGESYFFVREAFGQTFYHRNFNDRLSQGHFEDWTQNGTGMKATTIMVHQQSMMLSSEIGLRSFSPDHSSSLDFGIVLYAPFSKTYTDQYEFFKQNNSVGKSTITYAGSTVMLDVRYTFNYKIKTILECVY